VDLASVKLKILVIGGGRMGNAFIEGLSHSADNQIHVVEPISSVKAKLKDDFGVVVSNYNDPEKQMGEIVPLCDYVLICVKPQIFNKIKEALKNLLSDKQIVISIMAGISTENLCKGLGIKNAIRVMPNTPGQIGKGISVWYKKNKIDSKFEEGIKNILGALGESEEVYEEEIIDKATAISGSGPGYIFYFMESMLKSCKEIGIDENLSKKLIIKTFLGSAELAKFSEKDFDELMKEVTSPNGTTEAGLKTMSENNLGNAIILGIKSAYKRARELNND
tara:strand:- start:1072 stop:1905 length:834 start_codon:yes stop_codon:yes gene_type:complete